MGTFVARTLVIVSLVSTLVGARPGAAAEIFPDKNLEAAVRALIFDKKDPSKELTDEDMKKVYVLEAKGKGIRDLKGLEKCTNLALINFAKNEISDLTPLKDLKSLQSLDLSNNKITDIGPLAGLVGLQFLELSNNEIKNVEPLGKLTKLSALYMANNKVSDITPLGDLTRLSSLDLAKNEVSDIKPISNLGGLFTLKLSDNKIEDISPIPKKNNLKMLFLERNKITDLSPLVAAAQEDAAGEKRFAPFLRLYLEDNPLSDAAKNQQLAALTTAGVRLENAKSKNPK
jgi:Leucine-rich repeat (LRR) protein